GRTWRAPHLREGSTPARDRHRISMTDSGGRHAAHLQLFLIVGARQGRLITETGHETADLFLRAELDGGVSPRAPHHAGGVSPASREANGSLRGLGAKPRGAGSRPTQADDRKRHIEGME